MKPEWKDAPPWAQWLAQDADGRWHWYGKEPSPDCNSYAGWGNSFIRSEFGVVAGSRIFDNAGCGEPNPNWRDTLERRPQPEEAQGEIEKFRHKLGSIHEAVRGAPDETPFEAATRCNYERDILRGDVARLKAERRRLIEALRPLALAANPGRAVYLPLATHHGKFMLRESDALAARDLLRELGELPEPLGRVTGAELTENGATITAKLTPAGERFMRDHDSDCPDEFQRQVDALAHEPSRDELEDLENSLNGEGEPWWGANLAMSVGEAVFFSFDGGEMRRATEEEISSANVRGVVRCIGRVPVALNNDHAMVKEFWVGPQEPPDLDYRLPCDVKLPPATTIRKGVPLRTLLHALSCREEYPAEFTRLEINGEMSRQTVDDLVRSVIPKRARCAPCYGSDCLACKGTGRRHINGKPFYTAEEVADFTRTAREEIDGFPGGMNKA